MLINLLHRLVALPSVYDLAQFLAGATVLRKALLPVFASHVPPGAKVIDIGGGTGLNLACLPAACDYTCLDNDPQKIEGFQAKHPALKALLGDAAALPVADASFDVALMTAVSHHLPEDVLRGGFAEIARTLKPSGCFIFVDALWEPRRLQSRALWSVDRGANPRPYAAVRAEAEVFFDVKDEVRCAVHHRYVCWVLTPREVKSEEGKFA